MKKRTKILAIVAAAALAVGTMCFGFAAWSTQVDLNGTVSANGKWDLAVTDASITLSNNGAAFGTTTSETVFDGYADMYVGTATHYGDTYAEGKMSEKIAELEEAGATVTDSAVKMKWYCNTKMYNKIVGEWANVVSYYESDEYTYDEMLAARDEKAKQYISEVWGLDESEYTTHENVTVSSKGCIEQWYYVITYTADAESQTTWTDTTVNYADVVFSLPGAWAQYSVTITNNGTADATLTANDFDFSALDENIYEEVTPEFEEEVIAAGESCTFTFNVQIKEDVEDLTAEAANFKITLNYGANVDVDEAPAANHNHE